jgi:hypothetical protein
MLGGAGENAMEAMRNEDGRDMEENRKKDGKRRGWTIV